MLLSLHVKNLALIDEEEVSFTDGFNILTGETGAGKSVIIGSVNLALGAKADKSLIRTGEDYALIEMVFQADTRRQLDKLREMDLPVEEDGTILIKRKIYEGRSVCSICGETVSTRQLRDVAGLLIDIYGQRENQRLLKKEAQLGVIDDYAGEEAAALKEEVKASCRRYREYVRQWENDDLDDSARKREADLIAYEIREIEEAALKEGEDEELEKEYRRLSGFQKIMEAVQSAGMLGEGNDASAASLVERALRGLLAVEGLDEELDAITAQLTDIDQLLSEFTRSLSDYMDNLSFDPSEFRMIEERLDLINHLKDKYGSSIAAVQKALEDRQNRLSELENYDASRQKLEKDMIAEKEVFLRLCGKLSTLRKKSAEEFQNKLTNALLDLNFNQVDLQISVDPDEEKAGPDGYDSVSFMISTNPGESRRPLEQIASGGELSRIMLAMKTVFAGREDIHTLIFDEIDTGISGRTAWKVSEKIGSLALDHQIICITHLPQIAAMADSHYKIEKKLIGSRTATSITRLNDEDSLCELGRLLGTENVTETTLENARDMRRQALNSKRK